MELFLLFFLFATFILGILCLTVLEYQNQRSKKWLQTLPRSTPSQYKPHPNTHSQETIRAPEKAPPQEKVLSPAQVA